MPWWRRPPLQGWGRPVVAGSCAYELVSLAVDEPWLPPITGIVRMRHGWVLGGTIVIGLIHHFWIESE